MRHTLLVATTNTHKLGELRQLLADLPLDLIAPTDVWRAPPTVVEDGVTFAENARKKAVSLARASGLLTLADDSGLEVDALGGAPGVRSARYAHERATDGENRAALLAALDALGMDDPISIRNVGPESFAGKAGSELTARFRCSLALVDPMAEMSVYEADGTCEGSITRTGRGAGGFGYDPLFVVVGGTRTMAELSHEEKNAVSHRGRAIVAMRPHLAHVVAARAERVARLFA
ncbi:MAG: non-canonical purine NTP pyrophosphatase [Polyangiaceae bacterium]